MSVKDPRPCRRRGRRPRDRGWAWSGPRWSRTGRSRLAWTDVTAQMPHVLWPKSVTRSFWKRGAADPLPRPDVPAKGTRRLLGSTSPAPADPRRRRAAVEHRLRASGSSGSPSGGAPSTSWPRRRRRRSDHRRSRPPDLALPPDHDPGNVEARLRTVARPAVSDARPRPQPVPRAGLGDRPRDPRRGEHAAGARRTDQGVQGCRAGSTFSTPRASSRCSTTWRRRTSGPLSAGGLHELFTSILDLTKREVADGGAPARSPPRPRRRTRRA